MKKYLSVFLLYLRGCIYPCIGTMIGIGIGQAVLFGVSGLDAVNLKWALAEGISSAVITCSILLLSVQMASAFCDRGGKMNNTLQRLSISEKQGFWMHVVSNALLFTLYFLFQGLLFVLFCFWFNPQATGLEILVTSYDHPMFHQFFPLDDWWILVTNFVLILGLSIGCAAFPMRQRHGKNSITTFLMAIAACFYLFLQREGDHLDPGYSIFIVLVTIYCISVCLAGTLTLEVDDYE